MNLKIYKPSDLSFAYCYRVYFRFQTFRRRYCPVLTSLHLEVLQELLRAYSIKVLECATNETEVIALLSLEPTESISACAGKLKGRISKWLNSKLKSASPQKLVSRGYFACTVGQSRSEEVMSYLDKQAEHHNYDNRILPPVFVETFALDPADDSRLEPAHAQVISKFHVVLATWKRKGVLRSREGQKVTTKWCEKQSELGIAIIKVSFVPDHVHIALRLHPATSPAEVVASLMNLAQDVLGEMLVFLGLDQLWQDSAYLGSFGDLASEQVRKYMRRALDE